MGTTRRWRRFAAAGLGVFAGAVGGSVAWARWFDTAPLSSAQLHSGALVLLANGSAAATLTATITPQLDSAATTHVPITMSNAGNVALDYQLDDVTATASDPDLLTTGLTLRVGAATGAAACSGGTPGPEITLTTGNSLIGAAFTARRPLAASAAEVLCISLTAPVVTDANFLPGTADITLHFHGQNQ